jgi:hypothetical protein
VSDVREEVQKPKSKLTDKRPFKIVTYLFMGQTGLVAESYRIDELHGGSLRRGAGYIDADELILARGGAQITVQDFKAREIMTRVLDCEEWVEPELTAAPSDAARPAEPA